ncbi:ABC transporter ATP-binding protein [Gracilibacillus xinjiangensis]|uniref:ABC transporter ATP-binding protein n=1 Tax=Gracilibacillus xinjiangensis TaxID=1193282 RepID=A0ABV8WTZ6_9BACI
MSAPLIELDDVHKHYKQNRKSIFYHPPVVKAMNGVSFTLKRGESFGLVGESGSGKSTTGQVILQLLKQTSGSIKYKGKDVTTFTKKQLKEWRKNVQIVFQDPYSSLNPKKTIEWILHEPLTIHNIGDKAFRDKRILETIEDVGLDASFLDRYPHQLSGGQRQRVAIASALILEPEFIVIDEGVSALDVSVQAQILNLLNKLKDKYTLTYLFISHDLNVVQYFCDRIAIMYLGEIVEMGKTEHIGAKPKHPYAEALFSAIPHMESVQGHVPLKGDIPDPSNPPHGCPFHTRCVKATDICAEVRPQPVQWNESYQVKCHLYKQAEKVKVTS